MNFQIITPSVESITTNPGNIITFDIIYTTDPAGIQTSGLNLLIHYNSNELRLTNTESFENPLIDLPSNSDDSNDLDQGLTNSQETDSFLFTSWGSTSVEFPSQQPAILRTLEFEVLEDFDGTTINFTSNSTAPDFELDATSLNINTDGNETPILDDTLIRFQNSAVSGTFLFAGEEEAQRIRRDFPQFTEEGEAFNVSFEPQDDLVRFNRFQNSAVPGTFLFATESESVSIRSNFPNFVEEGIAFYTLGADANVGQDIIRFQNSDRPGTYIFVGEDEAQRIRSNFPQFVEEGVAFEVPIV